MTKSLLTVDYQNKGATTTTRGPLTSQRPRVAIRSVDRQGQPRDVQLRHLVASDEGYLAEVAGERKLERMPDAPLPLHELAERTRRAGVYWEASAQDPAVGSRELITPDGWRTRAVIPMAQAHSPRRRPSQPRCRSSEHAASKRPAWTLVKTSTYGITASTPA
jgi:hypothetical protein